MTRLKKELTKKGILYEADEFECMKGAEYDWCRQLVTITNDFIITVMYSAVLDPTFYLYDRKTFKLIGEQLVYPEKMFWGNTRTWCSCCCFE